MKHKYFSFSREIILGRIKITLWNRLALLLKHFGFSGNEKEVNQNHLKHLFYHFPLPDIEGIGNESRVLQVCLPFLKIRDTRNKSVSPFFFIRNWPIDRFSIVSIRNRTEGFRNCMQGIRNRTKTSNGHIFTHWAYFTQIFNESQIFKQMTIFSQIEHISHKYLMKVKFSHKWPYFHTLSIFHANTHWK
jgi:hypothetical protein